MSEFRQVDLSCSSIAESIVGNHMIKYGIGFDHYSDYSLVIYTDLRMELRYLGDVIAVFPAPIIKD